MAAGRGRAIEAGRAAVRFIGDRSPLQRTIRLAERDLRQFGRTVGDIGRSLTTAASATLAAFAIPVNSALRLEEALSSLDSAFGKEAKAARGFMSELRKELGLSQREAADALTSFQRFFVGMGFGRQEASQLSQELTRVTADLAAAGDISFDEAAGRIRSALTGSTTVLDQFGINLKQSAVEAEILARGLNKTTGDLTGYERATINASIITKQFASNGILGAAGREADSNAGKVRKLKGQMADLAATIGTSVIPVIIPMVEKLQEVVAVTSDWVKQNSDALQGVVRLAAKLGGLGVAFIAIEKAALAGAAAISVIRTAMVTLAALSATTAGVIGAIAVALLAVAASSERVRNAVGRFARGLKNDFDSILNVNGEISELLKAINSTNVDAVTVGVEAGVEKVSESLKKDLKILNELGAGFNEQMETATGKIIPLRRKIEEVRNGNLGGEVSASFSTRALREAFGIGTDAVEREMLNVQRGIKAGIDKLVDRDIIPGIGVVDQ